MEMDVKIQAMMEAGELSQKVGMTLMAFFSAYREVLEINHRSCPAAFATFERYVDLVKEQCDAPFEFALFHEAARQPFDYAQFGFDFIRPLVDMDSSQVYGHEQLEKIEAQLAQGHNAVLFANHQIEADPQAIGILLQERYPKLVENMIFVAGHRVTTDPLAVPLSMGCNLLCIYSKKYIETPPEEKEEKLLHNKRTMQVMKSLLAEGGKCIYMAPSGGRDRRNAEGEVVVAPFDPQSIAMFNLIAMQAKTPTHFFPLALKTFEILPPPETVQKALGEARQGNYSAAFLSFGEELDFKALAPEEGVCKHAKREQVAAAIHDIVVKDYQRFETDRG